MKSKLKYAVSLGFGMGVGIALHQVISHGSADADWWRAVYISVFAFILVLLIPGKWLGLDKESA